MKTEPRNFRDSTEPSDSQSSVSRASKKPAWQRPITYLSLMLLGAGFGFSGNYLASRNLSTPTLQSQLPAIQLPGQGQSNAPSPSSRLLATGNSNFVAEVVDQVGPAVVRIDSSRTVATQVPEALNDPFFRRFFGSQIPDLPSERTISGSGSGFIVNADGQIMTNAHVVDGADTVTVTLRDGRTFEGRVMGADPVTDVAVVKIESNDLPTVRLSDSEQIRPGQWAIAIGNPMGLDNTVTVGIVSATGRSSSQVGVPDKRVEFIQTDAAINPGNSGGPLLNEQGEVIGMNTAIIQGAQGLGFSIPINTVQRIADQLVATGRVEHPYLGIQMLSLTPQVKQNINSSPNNNLTITEDQGVLVGRVMPNSPAARAGLRSGDVIKQINGETVTTANDVQRLVEASRVGNSLQVELRRNGQPVNLSIQLGAFPAQMQ